MDFIEQWFGISPDGGDGSLELQWVVGLAIVVAAAAFRRRIIGWLRSHRSGKRPHQLARQDSSHAQTTR